MAKRIKSERVKKWAKVSGIVGVPLVILLIWFLVSLGSIEVTGYSGDLICEGTIEDPCLAYVNFTANEDIFIYPNESWGETPFETDVQPKSVKMYRSWGKGWMYINLSTNCKSKTCGASDNSGRTKYSFAFRGGREYRIKYEVLKNNPEDIIKWSFGPVDPTFYGYNKTKKEITLPDAKIRLNTAQREGVFMGKDRMFGELDFETYKDYKKWNGGVELYDLKISRELTEENRVDREVTFKYKNYSTITVIDYESICSERIVNVTIVQKYDCYDEEIGSHQEEVFEWIELNTSKDMKKGNITIGLFTDIYPGENMEWILTFDKVRLTPWAEWQESFNDGLVSYYYFNNGSDFLQSGDWIDKEGSPSYTTSGCKSGSCLSVGIGEGLILNQTSSYWDITSKSKNGTINFWMENITFEETTEVIVTNSTSVGSHWAIVLKADAIEWYEMGARGTIPVPSGMFMVTMIGNSTGIFNYINGVLDTSRTDGAATGMNQPHISVSQYPIESDLLIDDMAVWNRSLTTTELASLYDGGTGTFYDNASDVIPDIEFPQFTNYLDNNGTIETSGTAYFNVTVTLTNGTVILQLDGTNYSASNWSDPEVFNVTIDPLTSGVYPYDWASYGNGTENNYNVSDQQSYTVVASSPPTLSNFKIYALNSSKGIIGVDETSFNYSNLTQIESMNISFELLDPSGISGDIKIYFTANGSSGCSLGNNQSNLCYNFESESWIEFQNETKTLTYIDVGGKARGDSIECSYVSITGGRNYTCEFDEHYNPNVWKHYPFNFSNIKWQSGTGERINRNNIWKIQLATENIPLDADFYRLDFRVNTTMGVTPTQAIVAYLCNSTYSSGAPQTASTCQLVAGRLPSELQDDGTKFRAVFTKELISGLGDIEHVILTSAGVTSKYYAMKTYGWEGTESVRAAVSSDGGTTYTNLSDGYETELNLNWFYDSVDSNITQIVFKIYANDTKGNDDNSTFQVMTWDEGGFNERPIVDIITPLVGGTYGGVIEINWTTADPNADTYLTNVTARNGTDTMNIALNLGSTITNVTWDVLNITNPSWNITVESCENATSDLFCGNDTHEITIDNYLNLALNGFNRSIDMELKNSLNISADSSFFICIDVDHPDYGINASCGEGIASVLFNISYFRKVNFSEGPSNITLNHTGGWNVSNFSVNAHQYDEVVNLSVNMSSYSATNVTFYKCNSTSYDRAYDGILKGINIELKNFTDGEDHANISFLIDQQEIIKYFYLDEKAKTNKISILMNVSGALFGTEVFDVFENFSRIDYVLTDGNTVPTGSTTWSDFAGNPYTSYGWLMLANSSKQYFIYDEYDGTVDPDKWINATQPPFCSNTEAANYIFLDADMPSGTSGTVNCGLFPNWTSVNGLSQFTTDDLEFRLTSTYTARDDPGANEYDAAAIVLLSLGKIWNSSRLPQSGNPGFSSVETGIVDVTFNIDKINGTTYTVNITGFEEISQDQWNDAILCGGTVKDDANMVLNWTTGTWTIDDLDFDGCDQSGTLNNSFYWSVDYNNIMLRLNSHAFSTTNAEANIEIKLYEINRSLWYRDNSTITSKSVYDAPGDILEAIFGLNHWGLNQTGENITIYLSSDDGVTWDEVGRGVEHSFISSPGRNLKWRMNLTTMTPGYKNLTILVPQSNVSIPKGNPTNITFDFGDDDIIDYTIGGELNSSNSSVVVDLTSADISGAFITRRTLFDHLFEIPLIISSSTIGLVNIDIINITYDPNPVVLNKSMVGVCVGNLSGAQNFSISVSSDIGNITLNDLRFDYAGGNDTIEINAHSVDGSIQNKTNVTFWYSSFIRLLPYTWTDAIFFIPTSNSSKNISAYGQRTNLPIYNITTTNYGGKPLNLSIKSNESISCLNLTWGGTSTKPQNQKINTTWQEVFSNLEYLNNSEIWLWADLDQCNPAEQSSLKPQIQLGSYCESCMWDN